MSDVAGNPNSLPNPGVAAVLSFFIPGLGQFYTGRFWRGISGSS
jgi:TM2 domain-containing membrane protein YozV